MKKHLKTLLLAFTLVISASVFAQQSGIPKTEAEVKTMLCYKWKLTHMESEGQLIELPAAMGQSMLVFKADGTLLQIDEGNTENAKWTYEHKTATLTFIEKSGAQKQTLTKLTDKELMIKIEEEGMVVGMLLKKVE